MYYISEILRAKLDKSKKETAELRPSTSNEAPGVRFVDYK